MPYKKATSIGVNKDELFCRGKAVCRGRRISGMGKLAQPSRVAVTGNAASPGIFETLAALGRACSLARIQAALERIPAG